MSVKLYYSTEKTNSFRPIPWHFSTEKFNAYRGKGWRHSGFLAVSSDYSPKFLGNPPITEGYVCPKSSYDTTSSKLIITKVKGTLMLIPCREEQNDLVMLITLRGGFRGSYGRVEAHGAEILFQTGSHAHCVSVQHLVVRLTDPRGYVIAETGRRCARGTCEVFTWNSYEVMTTEEYEAWEEQYLLCSDVDEQEKIFTEIETKRKVDLDSAIEQDNQASRKAVESAIAEEKRIAERDRLKPELVTRINKVSDWRNELGLDSITMYDDNYVTCGYNYSYTEENVSRLELQMLMQKGLYPQFLRILETVKGNDLSVEIDNELRIEVGWTGYRFDFSETGIKSLENDLNSEIQKIQKVEAEEEIAEQKKVEAEELKRKCESAKELGLPSDIRIWKRTGGRTNCGNGWVIGSDGVCRENDSIECPRPRHKDEGYLTWNQVLPGEIVLKWAKVNSAANHEFEVVHLPKELTVAQLKTISVIEGHIEEIWDGSCGVASGILSPSIGKGWGLKKTSSSRKENQVTPSVNSSTGCAFLK